MVSAWVLRSQPKQPRARTGHNKEASGDDEN
jgi:hypothetical protein